MTNWFIKNKKFDINKVAAENNVSKVLAKLLVNRDIIEKAQVREFLSPDITKMHPPNLIEDLNMATSIIKNRIENKMKIRIVGDFDVDGIMSVYILYTTLKALGADVDYVIPDRVLDGYGINNQIVLNAKAQGIDTIITCDNGIAAFDSIKIAKNMDMTVIITDHHNVPHTIVNDKLEYSLPEADAIINPKKESCKYPFKDLCGAAIIFKLVQNLILEYKSDFNCEDLLEFVAFATICDVVDLVGENRTIVVEGLKRLQNTQNVGLNALIEISGLYDKKIGVYHIGFVLGPCFNASGRLDTAILGLSLLLEKNPIQAIQIAEKLKTLNDERKKITLDGVEKIDKLVESQYSNDKVLVAFYADIHESVAGIIAGRIKEKYNKPTIVLTKASEGVKGSARSIEGYDIFEELTKCSDILLRFGGHPMAAGMSLLEENIKKLREKLNKNCNLTDYDLLPKKYIDMQYPIQSVNESFITEIERLDPYGKANPKPIFGDKNINLKKAAILGKNKNVLKLIFDKDNGENKEAIVFKDIEKWVSNIEKTYGKDEKNNLFAGQDNNIRMDILYYPSINEYMGNRTIQFVMEDYRLVKHL